MNNIIICLTFALWIINYIFTIKKSIYYRNNSEKALIKNKINFGIIYLLIIFIIFDLIYFSTPKIDIVRKLLFSAMNLYILINSFYFKEKNSINYKTTDITVFLSLFVLTIIPFSIYFIGHSYRTTYYVLFIYLILNYYMTIIISRIIDRIKKDLVKNDSK